MEETEQEQAEIAEEETESAAKAEERDEEAEEEAEEEEEEDDPEDVSLSSQDCLQVLCPRHRATANDPSQHRLSVTLARRRSARSRPSTSSTARRR